MSNAFGGPEAHMWSLVNGGGGASIKLVQRGTTTLAAADTVINVGIGAVNTARATVTVTSSSTGTTTDVNTVGKGAASGRLTSGTNLRIGRFQAGGVVVVNWEVTEYQAGVSVQQVIASIDTVTAVDVGITAVNTAKAFLVMGGWECTNIALNSSAASFIGRSPRASLSSGTVLHLERGMASDRTDVVVFVVEIK